MKEKPFVGTFKNTDKAAQNCTLEELKSDTSHLELRSRDMKDTLDLEPDSPKLLHLVNVRTLNLARFYEFPSCYTAGPRWLQDSNPRLDRKNASHDLDHLDLRIYRFD
ncbi:hypothetical protein TNCV_3939511 [Trichonephila clavipes]|uniref:Uncharacterized protein n=1 Tax=Trichonephila clavipes TaxID=2585209 RepID=A0A8X6VVL7_TRICX|nr:hypothetical protein TNCV_3939511 [Trichonephila clavipes]